MIASGNRIRMSLTPGHYALLIYEPLPQDPRLNSCINYDLNLQIGYIRTALGQGASSCFK